MGTSFEITYQEEVKRKDIPRLDTGWAEKIQYAIREKLTLRPDFFGKPLRRSLKGYRKLRVGDYRVVFRIDGPYVLVFGIGHRSTVYEEIERRVHDAS